MKFSLINLVAGGLIASVLASPIAVISGVEKRASVAAIDAAAAEVDALMVEVKTLTASISRFHADFRTP